MERRQKIRQGPFMLLFFFNSFNAQPIVLYTVGTQSTNLKYLSINIFYAYAVHWGIRVNKIEIIPTVLQAGRGKSSQLIIMQVHHNLKNGDILENKTTSATISQHICGWVLYNQMTACITILSFMVMRSAVVHHCVNAQQFC